MVQALEFAAGTWWITIETVSFIERVGADNSGACHASRP
jgi:hypothetical protein